MATGAWSRLYADVETHPKTVKLASILGEDRALASLLRLWTKTTAKRPNGVWEEWELKTVLGDEVCDALVSSCFVSFSRSKTKKKFVVSSWSKVMGSYRETLRKRRNRTPKSQSSSVLGHLRDSEGTSPSPSLSRSSSSEGVQGEPKSTPVHPEKQRTASRWKPGTEIVTMTDLEQAVGHHQIAAAMSSREIAQGRVLLDGGPIQPHEIQEALDRCKGKSGRLLGYVFGIITGKRRDAAEILKQQRYPAIKAGPIVGTTEHFDQVLIPEFRKLYDESKNPALASSHIEELLRAVGLDMAKAVDIAQSSVIVGEDMMNGGYRKFFARVMANTEAKDGKTSQRTG